MTFSYWLLLSWAQHLERISNTTRLLAPEVASSQTAGMILSYLWFYHEISAR